MSFARLLLGSAALACALPAYARPDAAPAETDGAPADAAAQAGQGTTTDPNHQEIGANIVVTASLDRPKADLLGGTTVLSAVSYTHLTLPTIYSV